MNSGGSSGGATAAADEPGPRYLVTWPQTTGPDGAACRCCRAAAEPLRTARRCCHVHVVVVPVPGLFLDQRHKLVLLQATAALLSPGTPGPSSAGPRGASAAHRCSGPTAAVLQEDLQICLSVLLSLWQILSTGTWEARGRATDAVMRVAASLLAPSTWIRSATVWFCWAQDHSSC
ncbi:hypothetical protein CRUP_033743 [Coryphaenoides rupestris]|nr:hypothetical protein CRUP_033743 [Coryphaenoides rupestris]